MNLKQSFFHSLYLTFYAHQIFESNEKSNHNYLEKLQKVLQKVRHSIGILNFLLCEILLFMSTTHKQVHKNNFIK